MTAPSPGVAPARRAARWPKPNLRLARNAVQVAVALYLVFAGWQFYLFVQHFLSRGATPFVGRPPVVEAFLPLSALVALRAWLGTGVVDAVHPAGFFILVAVLVTGVVFGKAFCAWLCPLGALSEALWRLGRWLTRRVWRLPRPADWALQSLKYFLLAFFLKAILFDFTPAAALYFSRTSYNVVADVKMLYFFLQPGPEVVAFLGAMAALSLFLPNFWCRYLCPYGALLGLLGVFAPFRVRREPARCNGCQRCTRACPEGLAVAEAVEVDSPACSRCLDCVVACPRRGALGVAALGRFRLPATAAYPVAFLVAFFGILLAAQAAGYWESSVPYEMYARLIPRFDVFNHP